jgi:hypothetical protein
MSATLRAIHNSGQSPRLNECRCLSRLTVVLANECTIVTVSRQVALQRICATAARGAAIDLAPACSHFAECLQGGKKSGRPTAEGKIRRTSFARPSVAKGLSAHCFSPRGAIRHARRGAAFSVSSLLSMCRETAAHRSYFDERARPARAVQAGRARWEQYPPIYTRTETAASAFLLAQMRCEIPLMARKRKSRTRKTTTEVGPPDDLYDYARPPARRVGRPTLQKLRSRRFS